MLVDLLTKQGEERMDSRQIPWDRYPRPQMRRDSYLNLNGNWDFYVNYQHQGQICVPFCPESQLSGLHKHYGEGDLLNYSREFVLTEAFRKGRVLLHIGAADQTIQCQINGKWVGNHTGGYENITFDITEAVA